MGNGYKDLSGTVHSGTHSMGHCITISAVKKSADNGSPGQGGETQLKKPEQRVQKAGWFWVGLVGHHGTPAANTSEGPKHDFPKVCAHTHPPRSRLQLSFNWARGSLAAWLRGCNLGRQRSAFL